MYRESKELSVPAKTGKWHKLAETMRAGCRMRPVQCFGGFFEGKNQACAVGAIMAALSDDDYGDLDLPAFLEVGCPAPACKQTIRYNIIVHLNDDHRWTRETIADWLDTL
jgi:hypothetical protein